MGLAVQALGAQAVPGSAALGVKQALTEQGGHIPNHGVVDLILRNQAPVIGGFQIGQVLIAAGQVAALDQGSGASLVHIIEVEVSQRHFGVALHHGDHGLNVTLRHCAAVGGHIAVEAPFFPKQGGHHKGVHCGGNAVDAVVADHHRLRLTLPEGILKHTGIVFPLGLLIGEGNTGVAVVLRGIQHEMLRRCGGLYIFLVVTLEAPNVGGGHFASQEGILAEVFVTAAVSGVLAQVNGGAPEAQALPGDVVGGPNLIGNLSGDLAELLQIPALTHSQAGGVGGDIIPVVGEIVQCIDAVACLIGKVMGGNAQAGDWRRPGTAPSDFLLQGHAADQISCPLLEGKGGISEFFAHD